MSKYMKSVLTAAFAVAVIAAPATSFAQTSNEATSTGGREHMKDQNDADKTRKSQTTPGAVLQSGSGSSSGYTEANPAPPPNAQENAPRPNK